MKQRTRDELFEDLDKLYSYQREVLGWPVDNRYDAKRKDDALEGIHRSLVATNLAIEKLGEKNGA